MQFELTSRGPWASPWSRWLARCAAAALLGLAGAAPALGADAPLDRVQVLDPYIELHTGPGRGYPVFFVVPREQWIEIEMRRTDWFKVRTAGGKEGWVTRAQLENTLTVDGAHKTFRDVVLDDYLHRRLEIGAAWGHFSADPMLKAWASYNLAETVAVELAVGQVQGLYSGTSFGQADLLLQPWADRRLEPFFGVGVGRIRNVPNSSLVSNATTNSNMANAMVGVRYHVTDRFIVRLDWTAYTSLISASRTDQYHALSGGIAFFF